MALRDFYTLLIDPEHGNGSPISYAIDTASPQVTASPQFSGQLCAWDAVNKVLIPLVSDAATGKYVGITRDSLNTVQKLGNQAALQPDRLSVFRTGVHQMTGTVGDTYIHGDALFMGADTGVVTKVAPAGGVQVGTVWLPDGSSKVGAVLVPFDITPYTSVDV